MAIFWGSVFLFGEEGEERRIRIELVNGDIVSGALVEESSEFVSIYSPYAGVIVINRSAVLALSYLSEAAVKKDPKPKEVSATPAVIVADLGVESGGVGDDENLRSGWVDQLAKSLNFGKWKKRMDFGLTSQSGRKEKSDFSLRYTMDNTYKNDSLKFQGTYYYSETDDDTTTDKNSALFRWRHDFAPGIFYQTDSSYSSDAIKEIDYDLEQKFGLGYRLIERDKVKLSSGMGATARQRQEFSGTGESFVLVNLFQDWEHKLNKRLSLYQDFRIAAPINDSDLYEMDFSAAIVSEITETLNFTVRLEFEYDNSLDEDLKEDQRLISSVGYDF